MRWRTTFDEDVSAGDVVALSILGQREDVSGLIVGPGTDGRIACLLGDHDDPNGTRPRLEVEAYQLRMLLRKGVSPKVPSDYSRATPAMRDPETETDDADKEEGGGETETLAA